MDVSVIIVNYNTKELTLNCVNSVYEKSTGIIFEIIIVDNASKDGSKELFENDSRIKYIYLPKNIGFGRANNFGYKYAKGKYIFCLNSDTILINNAILLFYEKMENSSSNIGCMGTILKDKNLNEMHSYGKFPTVMGNLWWRLGNQCVWKDPIYMRNENTDFFAVDYVTGADLFIRKSTINECGFFDEDFFLYFEETEMQWRFVNNGFKNYIYSIPQIIHLEGGSAPKHTPIKITIKKIAQRVNSERLYFKKTNGLLYYCFVTMPYIFTDFILILSRTFFEGITKKMTK